MPCLDDDDVLGFVEGRLEPAAIARADAHLAACASCREIVAAVARGSKAPVAEPPAVGERVGRYVVLDTLGAGAMGTVYAAWDPDLDRRVAIKVLRERHDHDAILREGRAIAKLAHPHVVAVHDVGLDARGVFFAMELVERGTLATWGVEPIDRVVAAYEQAARGLAAAHAAGLVHRDVKPSNLLVGADGRVRVADFGLAADGAAAASLVGTPLYMAPEVMAGGVADARADQYALAVSLLETLGGQAPFAGRTLDELRAEKRAVTLARPVRAIPAAVLAIARRALASEPSARWPSVAALADRLAHVRGRHRRRRLWIGGTGVALALGATIAFAVTRRGDAVERCADGPARFAEVWTPARAAELRTVEGDRVVAALDRYGEAWSAGYRRVCEATQRGAQSGALLDVRMRCLDEQRRAVTALVDVLAGARGDGDAAQTTRQHAMSAVLALAPVTECDQTEALAAIAPPPPMLAAEVAEAGRAIDRAEALGRAGRFDEGLAAVVAVPAVAYPELTARAAFVRADLEQQLGDAAAAEASLARATRAAAEAHDDLLAARAWTLAVGVVGYLANRPAEGLQLARVADAAIVRANADDTAIAELAGMRGLVYDLLGKLDDARAEHTRALAIRERTDPDGLAVALVLDNLGAIPLQQEHFDEAAADYARSLAIRRRLLGDDHPDVAASWNALGAAQRGLGHLADARTSYDTALAIWRRTLGDHHPNVAAVLVNLGHLAREQSDPAASQRYLEAAVAAWRALGDEHAADLASALGGLANLAFDRGDFAAGEAQAREGLALMEHALSPTHPRLASLLDTLSRIRRARGDTRDADALAARAAALRAHR